MKVVVFLRERKQGAGHLHCQIQLSVTLRIFITASPPLIDVDSLRQRSSSDNRPRSRMLDVRRNDSFALQRIQ
jgi:hypothetical protein